MREHRIEHAARNPYIRLAALLGGLFLFGWLVYGLRAVLTPVFISFLIAYLLDPVVDWFERRRVNRSAAIFILLVALSLGAAVLLVLIGLAVRDLRDVIEGFPAWLRDQVLPWLQGPATEWVSTNLGVQIDVEGVVRDLGERLSELAPRLAGPVQSIISSALSGTLALVGWLANLVLIPLFSFYLLRDFDRIVAGARSLIPPKHRAKVGEVFKEIDRTIAAFVRGQLLIMLILGILYGIGLTISGVKMGMGIGLLAGLLAVVPYLGFIVGIGLAIIMSLMGGEHMWPNLIGTGITFGVVQLLEGTVITPKIMGDKVGLHPVWVIVALLVGAHVLGVLGMLLAIPAAAVIKILLRHARARYEASELYEEGETEGEAVAEEAPPAEEEPEEEAEAEEESPAEEEEAEGEAAAEEEEPPAEEEEEPPDDEAPRDG